MNILANCALSIGTLRVNPVNKGNQFTKAPNRANTAPILKT